jgi:hypothetical protein
MKDKSRRMQQNATQGPNLAPIHNTSRREGNSGEQRRQTASSEGVRPRNVIVRARKGHHQARKQKISEPVEAGQMVQAGPLGRAVKILKKSQNPSRAASLLNSIKKPQRVGRILSKMRRPRRAARILSKIDATPARIVRIVGAMRPTEFAAKVLFQLNPKRAAKILTTMNQDRPDRAGKILKALQTHHVVRAARVQKLLLRVKI